MGCRHPSCMSLSLQRITVHFSPIPTLGIQGFFLELHLCDPALKPGSVFLTMHVCTRAHTRAHTHALPGLTTTGRGLDGVTAVAEGQR